MLIKKKSLLVIVVSSGVISLVLISALIGFLIHAEIRERRSHDEYKKILGRLQARLYADSVQIGDLSLRIATSGALTEKPIIEGTVRNNGQESISHIIVKVHLKDENGADIYEILFNALEPSLGTVDLARAAVAYFQDMHHSRLAKYSSKSFKHVLVDCPHEIYKVLRQRALRKDTPQWPGRITSEIVSIEFAS